MEKAGQYFTCIECGKDFWCAPSRIRNGGGKYCSAKCKDAKGKFHGKCIVCQKEYVIQAHVNQRQHSKYCSQECYHKRQRPNDVQRFMAKIHYADNGCWEWTSALNRAGYGVLNIKGKVVLAHRFSFLNAGNTIPPNTELDHLCRNRKCVNPAHLEPVSHHINILRGESPVAKYARNTHCPKGHEFTPDSTYIAPGRNDRQCRICRKIARAKFKETSGR